MMQEKNHKSSLSNGGALLSVFFLTPSLVNLDIYKLQWLGKRETRCQVSLIYGCFQRMAAKTRQKLRFCDKTVSVCTDPAPPACLLEGDL